MSLQLYETKLTFECKIILLKVDSTPNQSHPLQQKTKFNLNQTDRKGTFLWETDLNEVTRNPSNQNKNIEF